MRNTELTAAAVREGDSGVLLVEGPLDQRTVVATRDAARPLVERRLDETQVLIMDFSGVTRADSSAISFVLHWMRRAKAKSRTLELRNVPEQMLALARTSRMEQYFCG